MSQKIFDTGTILPENFVLTEEFKKTFELIENKNINVFITGKAGTGKYLKNKLN
jgi:DNA-binding NtrC family response regulator